MVTRGLMKCHSGQTVTEYALIGLFCAVICIPALMLLGQNVSIGFHSILLPPEQKAGQAQGPASSEGVASQSPWGGSPVANKMNSGLADGFAESHESGPVQTVGANGDELALLKGVQDLKDLYSQLEDPTARILIANLLSYVDKSIIFTTGGIIFTENKRYTLDGIQIVPANLREMNEEWVTVQGSSQFQALSESDRQRLTQAMAEIQTQTQYFEMSSGG